MTKNTWNSCRELSIEWENMMNSAEDNSRDEWKAWKLEYDYAMVLKFCNVLDIATSRCLIRRYIHTNYILYIFRSLKRYAWPYKCSSIIIMIIIIGLCHPSGVGNSAGIASSTFLLIPIKNLIVCNSTIYHLFPFLLHSRSLLDFYPKRKDLY